METTDCQNAEKDLISRVIILILDSVGIGELPDAAKYGDEGSNTLVNTAEAVGGINLPNLRKLGLGNIGHIRGVSKTKKPLAAYGKLAERSAGKDTTTGHWELMGLYLSKPFPTYPNGFPDEIIKRFEVATGRKVLGNKPASGTEIIKELGKEHIKTGKPIVYTSADSVFQIAAHKEVIPLDELYDMCKIARNILKGEHKVGRVIARPFIGESGNFQRMAERKDFSIEPPDKTVLEYASNNGVKVIAIGKIAELFGFKGISEVMHTRNNMDGVDKILRSMRKEKSGIIFANLVDFDMLWGHRNDPEGYAKGLEAVDKRLPEVLKPLRPDDMLIITADHGCDPTTESTDHSREYVPLLIYGERIEPVNLGTRETFADVGKTISDLLGFEASVEGTSFASKILRRSKR